MELGIKAVKSNETIVIHYNGDTINLQKSSRPALYKKVEKWIDEKNLTALMDNFADIKSQIESYSQGEITVDKGELRDKLTGEVLPIAIAKKFASMKEVDADYKPFSRFWTKLRQNPSIESKKDLYGFMLHNKIPISELGDILVEKGVRELSDGRLVDCHTGTMDNSIGMIVEMPREKVDADRNRTCSHGLHVGAPDYVRQWYSNDFIVICAVNPKDVVSVPTDYKNTKMRVCRYQVIGLAGKSRKEEPVIKLSSIVDIPVKQVEIKVNKDITASPAISSGEKISFEVADLQKLTAQKIIDHVKEKTGITINLNLKNKQGIINRANKLLAESTKTASVDFSGKTCKEIIQISKDILPGVNIDDLAGKDPRRGKLLYKLRPLISAKGIEIIDK